MSQTSLNKTANPTSPWQIYLVVVGVGVTCGTLILAVHEATRQRITDNRAAYRDQAAITVLPGAIRVTSFRWDDTGQGVSGHWVADGDRQSAETILAGYDPAGALVGVAIEAAGRGYQDTIRLIYGYSPTQQVILGFRILESRETPGLGDRVETDSAFVDQFRGLPVQAIDRGNEEPRVELGGADQQRAWQVDGISGATVTSRAVARTIAESVARWFPRIEADLSTLREAHL